MTAITLEIFELLVSAGIDAESAKPLAEEILTRSEAKEFLATRSNLQDMRIEMKGMENRLIFWMVRLQVAMGGLIFAAIALA